MFLSINGFGLPRFFMNNYISSYSNKDIINQKIKFTLYTELKQTGYELEIETLKNLNNSILDSKKQIKIIVHGWNFEKVENDWFDKMRDNYLEKKNCHVITVEWSSVSSLLEYYDFITKTRIFWVRQINI